MPKFAANLTMLFTELPVIERFAAARANGFSAVEFLFPHDQDVDAIEHELKRLELKLILFNLPVGDFASGDRGLANDPDRIEEFEHGAAMTARLANRLGVRQVNCLIGKSLPDINTDKQHETLVRNLRHAAGITAQHEVRLLIEPLNTIETPGFLVSTARQAIELIHEVEHENLWLQFDVYHEQRMSGNIVATIDEYIDRIAHIQIADSPARHHPGSGEINYHYVLDAIDAHGYDGWVSLEFNPETDTESALADMRMLGLLPVE